MLALGFYRCLFSDRGTFLLVLVYYHDFSVISLVLNLKVALLKPGFSRKEDHVFN